MTKREAAGASSSGRFASSALLRADGLRAGASDDDIARLEGRLAVRLPGDHAAFLLTSNGYNGEVGARGYAQLWSVDELVAGNEGYEGLADVPGLTLIGSNGGPTAYGFDADGFVSIPFLPMQRDEIRRLGATFGDFLAAIARGEGW